MSDWNLPAKMPLRSLPVALAQASLKPHLSQERLMMLNRLYAALKPIDQLRCRAEISRLRQENADALAVTA